MEEDELPEYHILDSPECYRIAAREYQKTIVEYALEIVEDDPYEALKLYHEADGLYDEVGHLPGHIIDLSMAIVKNIAKVDMNRAITVLDIIEVEVLRLEVVNELLTFVLDNEQKNTLNELMITLKILLNSDDCESRPYEIHASELTFGMD